MSFLTPLAFLLLSLIPIIILLYLLKRRRNERTISSIYLWQRMVRDVEANAPWQRLRRNLLLLLQLLFLIALIFALARPATPSTGPGGSATILILDTSASMAATDIAPTRLEAAKDQAQRIIDGLPDEARVTIIEAGPKARVLLTSSSDRRLARQAIENLQNSAGSSDLGTALQLAAAIADRQPETETILLSDGNTPLPERFSMKGHLSYLPIGLSGDNQAISLFSVERSPDGTSTTAFAQVTNYSQSPVQRRLALYTDGTLENVYDLDIPADGEQAILAEGLPADLQLAEARLLPEENDLDYLLTDDSALTVQRSLAPAQVTVISYGNRFLDTALGLLPELAVSAAPPDAPGYPPADLTIFDNFVPITASLPAGNLLFIAPLRSSQYFSVTGVIDAPTPQINAPDSPILSNISMDGVHILDSTRIPLPSWAEALIVAAEPNGSVEQTYPLLFAGEIDGRRIAVLAFDLRHSDLPIQIAFPLLISNLTNWLAPGSAGAIPTQLSPGAPLNISLPFDVREVIITKPDGSKSTLSPESVLSSEGAIQSGQILFADTYQLGLYEIQWGQEPPVLLAVNLVSPQESLIQPAASLDINNLAQNNQTAGPNASDREWWRPLVILALIILTAEWIVYRRPALAYLTNRWRQYQRQRPN